MLILQQDDHFPREQLDVLRTPATKGHEVSLRQFNGRDAARSLLVQAKPAGGAATCSFELNGDSLADIDAAVKQSGCSELELRLNMPLALLDTAALASPLPRRVTIRGLPQSAGRIPTLQVQVHHLRARSQCCVAASMLYTSTCNMN